MQFAARDRLGLPCRFAEYRQGELHRDGRRYLPLIVLEVAGAWLGEERPLRLGVVDRHHRVDPALLGEDGTAQILSMLGTIAIQRGERRYGMLAERGSISAMPEIYGAAIDVTVWEVERGHLPYETLYTELLLDIGAGAIGVRTNVAAPSLAAKLGAERIVAGDSLQITRSRIDILGFVRANSRS